MANKYKAVAITTPYWRPGKDYLKEILNSIENKIEDGDFVTISEKAISTATDNILDETLVNTSCLARFLAKNWMRFIWSKVLGPLCHLRKKTIRRLRAYPIREGSLHKQVTLERAGFLQALMHGSEGAIDASNLPYSYVSLPLNNAQQTAEKIQGIIKSKLGKNVIVVIVDTDKTYSLKTFHFTPRPRPLRNIHTSGGLIAYLIGRSLKLKQRATPTAVAGSRIRIEEALEVADVANRSRGYGAGRTVWDMAKTFRVPLTEVTWDMLDKVKHQPIVIVKPRNK